MAEQFVIPKAFTKEWFSYVWDYYKYHILGAVAALLLIIYTIFEISTTVRYDTNINYIATNIVSQENEEKICDICEKGSKDINDNGKVDVSFSQINFTQEAKLDGNMYSALMNKMMAMFSTEEELVYIMDKAMMDSVVAMESTEGLFLPASEWSGAESGETEFGVSLENSEVFKEAGVDTTDMYVLVRATFNTENEELLECSENAISLAKFLVK